MKLRSYLSKFETLKKIKHKVCYFNKFLKNINIYQTIKINFKYLSLREAIKFPIILYGKIDLLGSEGKIEFNCKVKFGLIKIGKNTDFFSARNRSLIIIDGIIIFNGAFLASNGVTITVFKNSKLIIGDLVSLGSGSKLRCYNYIKIGTGTGIVEECQVFDTNFHCIKDTDNGYVTSPIKPIIIGDFCWIGNRTSVMKGTVLTDFTIVASNSLLNKNYKLMYNLEYPVIGGTPAKLLSNNKVRILDTSEEKKVFNYYNTNKKGVYMSNYDFSYDNAYICRKQLFDLY